MAENDTKTTPQAFQNTWWGYVFETLKPYGLGSIVLILLAYWIKPYIERIIESDLKNRDVQSETLKLQAKTTEKIQETQEGIQKAVESINEAAWKQHESDKVGAETNIGIKDVLEKISPMVEDIHKNTKPKPL